MGNTHYSPVRNLCHPCASADSSGYHSSFGHSGKHTWCPGGNCKEPSFPCARNHHFHVHLVLLVDTMVFGTVEKTFVVPWRDNALEQNKRLQNILGLKGRMGTTHYSPARNLCFPCASTESRGCHSSFGHPVNIHGVLEGTARNLHFHVQGTIISRGPRRPVEARGGPRRPAEVRGGPRRSAEVRGGPRRSAEVRGGAGPGGTGSRGGRGRGGEGKLFYFQSGFLIRKN